jgi:flagellar FliL protein
MADNGDGAAATPKKSGVVGIIVATLLAAMIGGGHGFGMAKWAATPKGPPKADKPEAAASAEMILRELAPIVTNLANSSDSWVRLEGGILIEAAAAKQSDALAAQIGTDILAYLRTLSIAQLQGANGLAFLREDLNERIRQRSQGKAREIVIQTLVVQ